MLIEVTNPKPPFDKPSFDCHVTVDVGGIRYDVGPSTRSELREDALAFARGLQERKPFAPEFGYEPLFNVSFEGERFVTFLYRPRFKRHFPWWLGPRWLLSNKVVSRPESVVEATAYLTQFAANLSQP
jgi:hypothetical protein